jgi:hypothetical protein
MADFTRSFIKYDLEATKSGAQRGLKEKKKLKKKKKEERDDVFYV